MTSAPDAGSSRADEAHLVEDYEVLRHGVGAVALVRDVLAVSGPDAAPYLQGQLSQDVAALGTGESADSLILTPQGKLDALVRVSRTGDDSFVLDMEGGFGQVVAARLARFKLRVKVVIEELPWRCVALRGPRASDVGVGVGGVAPGAGASVAAVFSWNGVSGVDVLGEAPEIPAGVRLCGLEAWEAVRVEAGIPVMGAELDERTIAAEADLLERAVSFTKGCYTGQELVARLDARGNRVARHLRALVVDTGSGGVDAAPSSSGIPPGSEIVWGDKVVGSVTSSAWSPTLGCAVALGYVHRSVEPPCPVQLRLSGPGSPVDPGRAPVVGAEVRTVPLV